MIIIDKRYMLFREDRSKHPPKEQLQAIDLSNLFLYLPVVCVGVVFYSAECNTTVSDRLSFLH